MPGAIVVGTPGGGPRYLADTIWKPENWRLVRGSAFAKNVNSEARVLVTGLGSHPPVGTVIDWSEMYYTDQSTFWFVEPSLSGLWAYCPEHIGKGDNVNIALTLDHPNRFIIDMIFEDFVAEDE